MATNRNTRNLTQMKAGRYARHGLRQTPEYDIWAAMVQRCTNPDNKNFDDYGGRGIKVCDRWMTFINFYNDVAPRPSGMTIERVKNDQNYGPDNYRWATRKDQARNTRRNIMVIYRGREMCISEACELSGVSVQTAFSRRNRGWPDDKLFIETLRSWSNQHSNF